MERVLIFRVFFLSLSFFTLLFPPFNSPLFLFSFSSNSVAMGKKGKGTGSFGE